MPTSRRSFLKTSAIAGGALGLGIRPASAAAGQPEARVTAGRPRSAPMRILVLGGTGFIGPHQVRYAVERGHHVTIFTRGRRQADLPASVEYLVGDRDGQLGALEGKKWDAVIDNSATNPEWVRQSAQLLAGSAGRYMYVSSTGVFYPYLTTNIDESVQPALVDDPVTGETKSYGVQKSLSEREVQQAFGDRAIIIRPHFIVGPGDTTDRFPYWPVRIARGGEVLAPGRPTDPVQLIDVRDLTQWMVRMLEDGHTGVYNAAGPRGTLTMAEMLYGIRAVTTADVTWTWVDDYDFLEANKVGGAVPWILLRGKMLGMTTIRSDRAIAKGLTYRPLAETARDTLAGWPPVPEPRRTSPRFVFTPEREAELLAAWKAHRRGS